MNLTQAATLARTAMQAHELEGWTFQFNRRKSSFGVCKHLSKTIELSSILTQHADREQVVQTIGHEIAHALVGHGAGHGPIWKAQMISMGLRPDRCGESNDQQRIVLQSTAKYIVTCSVTGKPIATMDRLVKERRTRHGVRRYKGHRCKCHGSLTLYNGKTWDQV